MSNKPISTEIGGEQTQYEGTHTFVDPPSKLAGQLGATDSSAQHTHQAPADIPKTQGVSKADKIRYGQSIQEGGAGGKTVGMQGDASVGGGFGGTKAIHEQDQEDGAAKGRMEQGYGAGRDMSGDVGA
ncbi:hypothetical protein IQ07DRAFT_644369 [Pyrenochaeta sp. DS3sAY3a]|nr:hypothetical protein IQ07DRAFT_644369 [Pyrenochaeta sp. DS3sAY3a]